MDSFKIEFPKEKQVNEIFLRAFGETVKSILRAMFGQDYVPITVKGTRAQINSFAEALAKEKNYLKAYQNYGLNNPETYRSKYRLTQAVKEFERKTGVPWPFK